MISYIKLEIQIILIAISIAILYGISPITYKLLVINNNISFELYILLSTFILFICALCYSLLFNEHSKIFIEISKINIRLLLLIIIYVIIVVFTTQLLFYYAIKKSSNISIFTIITGFYPIITLLLAILILNEKISLKIFIGFLIVIIGIIIMTY